MRSYRNLKVHRLLGKCAHVVIKAKAVLAHLLGREYEVSLALFGRFHDHFAIGADDAVIEIKGSAGLDLNDNLENEGLF